MAEEFGKRTEGRAASDSEEKPEERDVIKAKRRENVEKKEVVMCETLLEGRKGEAWVQGSRSGRVKVGTQSGSRLRKQYLNEDVEVAEPASLFNNVCCELGVEERGSFFFFFF